MTGRTRDYHTPVEPGEMQHTGVQRTLIHKPCQFPGCAVVQDTYSPNMRYCSAHQKINLAAKQRAWLARRKKSL